jgi:hypothetical protein
VEVGPLRASRTVRAVLLALCLAALGAVPVQAHTLSVARAAAATRNVARRVYLSYPEYYAYGLLGCVRVTLHAVDCKDFTRQNTPAGPLECHTVMHWWYVTGSYVLHGRARASDCYRI